jgi:multisubunit Na+/H+ antiporter MnhG subunit
MAKRTEPLQAKQHDGLSGAAAEAEAEMAALASDVNVTADVTTPSAADPHAEARRLQRLADGVRSLRTGGGTLKLSERTLMVIAGVLAPLGLILILVGWWGAANTPNLFEQIPYAISGGLFGLGLLFLGSFCYFAHWMTELVKEHRAQAAAVVEAITRLEDVMRTAKPVPAAAPATADGTAPPVLNGAALVATEKGTMAHRPECVVVAGKNDLRPVSPADGLAPCKLCEPYLVAAN